MRVRRPSGFTLNKYSLEVHSVLKTTFLSTDDAPFVVFAFEALIQYHVRRGFTAGVMDALFGEEPSCSLISL